MIFKNFGNLLNKNLDCINFYFLKFVFNIFKYNLLQKKKFTNGVILFDHFEVPFSLVLRSVILRVLAKVKSSELLVFNNKYNLAYNLAYKTIGAKNLKIKLNKNQKKQSQILFVKIKKKIKSKEDIIKIRINKIYIGIDIYESYLIRNFVPTVNINDKKLWTLVSETIDTYVFWKDFFKDNKVKGVFLSHRMYVETNIINKIALKNKIPIYTMDGYGSSVMKLTTLKLSLFDLYKKFFNKLKQKEKRIFIDISKKAINKKLSGVVGVNMDYSKKSAFSKYSTDKNPITRSKKVNILICTHCFFDNPHAYGQYKKGNLFIDFYEWINFLSKISHKTNYNWFIKPHRDYLPGTIEIISSMIKKFTNIELVNPNSSFHQLKINLDHALTVYGSVAHELPLLGVNVINASKINPHMSYNFSITPKNLQDYKHILLNLKKVNKKKININLKEIYSFYYMHNYFFKDNLFQNFRKITNDTNNKNLIYNNFSKLLNNGSFNNDIKKLEFFYKSNDSKYFSNNAHKKIFNNVCKNI
tara:strand:- start:1100 stop:2683 length:1584 start_codon:yes stop_codon:yes gene_type:complete